MVAICFIGMILGVIGAIAYYNMPGMDKKFLWGSITAAVGGLVGGCFATPSRDLPAGSPGLMAFAVVMILAGAFMVVSCFVKKNQSQEQKAENKKKLTVGIAVTAVIVVILLIIISTSDGSSGGNSGISGRPWEDLGVSRSEYMEVYNYYKYGK